MGAQSLRLSWKMGKTQPLHRLIAQGQSFFRRMGNERTEEK